MLAGSTLAAGALFLSLEFLQPPPSMSAGCPQSGPDPMLSLQAFTDFGDAAVLLPLSAALLCWLLATRPVSAAGGWLTALAFCAGVTALLKIYLFACPVLPDLESPSGHTSFSAVGYGALAMVAAAERRSLWQKIAIAALAAGVVGGIAFSRVLLGSHSLREIGLGFAIGAGGLAIFTFAYLRVQPRNGALAPLILATIIVLILFHGVRLHLEELLQTLSGRIHVHALACG